MEKTVADFIGMCEWDSAQYLIVSDNVFGPLIYYSHLLPLVGSLLLVLFIFAKNRQSIAVKWLLATVVLLSIWLFSDLVLWATEKPTYTMFFWSIVNMVEPMIYAGMLFFTYSLLKGQDISFRSKIITFVLLLPTVLLASTSLNLQVYDLSNCYREAIEGPLAYYGYMIELIFTLWIVGIGLMHIVKSKDAEDRWKTLMIVGGVAFFLLSFAMGNVIGSLLVDWILGQYGLFGIPVFLAVLAYIIVRYKAFDIKLIAAQALITTVWLLIFAILFIREIENVRLIVSVTLLLIMFLGFQLVRSVRREVYLRESLEVANRGQASLIHFMNHQIKGRFGNIKNIFAELDSGDYGNMPADTVPLLKKGLDEANVGVTYVQGILNGASAEKGTISYNMTDIDFKSIVENAHSEQKEHAEKKGLEFTLDVKEGVYAIKGDMLQLGETVRNLFDNSINYTPTGSVRATLENIGNKVRLIISDTGVGLTADDKSKLFKAGGRGADSLKVNVNATGYGLVFVKGVIEAHKGRVWAESAGRDQGSTLYLEIPKA